MSEYIDRDAAISAAIDAADNWDGGPNRGRWAIINAALESIPAADVRPVVLCKDCKNADYSGMGPGGVWCNEMERAMRETDFCSRGAKMEGE